MMVSPASAITFGDSSTALGQLGDIRSYCVGIVESFTPEF